MDIPEDGVNAIDSVLTLPSLLNLCESHCLAEF